MGNYCAGKNSASTRDIGNFQAQHAPQSSERDDDLTLALALSLQNAAPHATSNTAGAISQRRMANLDRELEQLARVEPCFSVLFQDRFKGWMSMDASSTEKLVWLSGPIASSSNAASAASNVDLVDERGSWGWSFGRDGLITMSPCKSGPSAVCTVELVPHRAVQQGIFGNFADLRSQPFSAKVRWFEAQVASLRSIYREPIQQRFEVLEVFVERRHLFDAALHALLSQSAERWQQLPFKVQFVGEPGMDAGGLTREFYSLVVAHVCSSSDGDLLHRTSTSSALYELSPGTVSLAASSTTKICDLSRIRFLGRIIGKALLDGICPGITFSIPLLKLLTSRPLVWRDLQFIDEVSYRSMLQTLDMESDEVESLCLDFSAQSSFFEYPPEARKSEETRTTMDAGIEYKPNMVEVFEVQLESGAWAPYSPEELVLFRQELQRSSTAVVPISNKFGSFHVDLGNMNQLNPATGYRRPIRKRDAPEPFDVAATENTREAGLSGSTTSRTAHKEQVVILRGTKAGNVEDVSSANLVDFILHLSLERLCLARRQRLSALCRGVFEVVPAAWLAAFEPMELALLLGGTPTINVAEWRQHTVVEHLSAAIAASQHAEGFFWDVVKAWEDEKRSRLLRFATGSARVPIGGFPALCDQNGTAGYAFKLKIVKRDGQSNSVKTKFWRRLPRGHTCFNTIDLPCYISYEEMKECLEAAISLDMNALGISLE